MIKLNKNSHPPETMAGSLMEKSRRLHPIVRFCGDPPDAILNLPEELLRYILSILKDTPMAPPDVPPGQWSQLLPVLAPHGIIPLLYQRLKKLPKHLRVPPEIMDKMRYAYLMHTGQALREEKQMQEIVDAFTEADVRIIALKGFALARMVYPGPGTRPGSDLDLLVVPDQMAISRMVMERLGYKCLARRFEVSRDYYDDELFVRPDRSGYERTIELHWDLHRYSGISRDVGVQDFFERAVKIKANSFTFEALNPVDALIHRAINNAFDHDRDVRLCWLYDIAALAKTFTVPEDWKLLQERSVAWRARLAVEHSLRMAQYWLSLELPPKFEDFSTWPKPTDIEINAWSRVIGRFDSFKDHIKLFMSDSTGPVKKIRYFFYHVIPARSTMDKGKNNWQIYSAYVQRLKKWVLNYIR